MPTTHQRKRGAFLGPAAHAWQYTDALRFTAPEPKRPGTHASQKNVLGVDVCLPAGQFLHELAFSFSEYVPAGQGTQLPLLTNVPGLQMPQ